MRVVARTARALFALFASLLSVVTSLLVMARASQQHLSPAGFPHLELPESELDGNRL